MQHSTKILRTAINGLKVGQIAFNASKTFIRNSSVTTWNKDWKPGPYPRTKEERLVAAKKYNMLPEDYEPYPEEEGFGDYPMFHKFHMESRDPFEAYDFPELKRNYGEPIHPDVDVCIEDKTNFQTKHRTPIWKQLLYVVTGVSLWTLMVLHGELYLTSTDRIPKQFPYSGQVHYTFEAAE